MKNRVLSNSIRCALFGIVLSTPTLSVASPINFSDFFGKSRINASLVNRYQQNEEFYANPNNEHDSQKIWGQQAAIFFRSGQVNLIDDFRFNIDLGYSQMFKLYESTPTGWHKFGGGQLFESSECHWTGNEPGKGWYVCDETSGFGKLPVANARFAWGDRDTGGDVRIGDGFYNTGLISTSSEDDVLLASYRGVVANYKWDDYAIDGGVVWGFMKGNQSKMSDLTGSSSYYMPKAYTYGNLYTARIQKRQTGEYNYKFAFARAEDYISRYQLSYEKFFHVTPEADLYFRAQYYYNKGHGSFWEKEKVRKTPSGVGGTPYDEYATAATLDLAWRADTYRVFWGMSSVNAPKEDGFGAFSYGFGNAKGVLSMTPSTATTGFRRDGEIAHAIGFNYYFDSIGLPDLMFEYKFAFGFADVFTKAGGVQEGKEVSHGYKLKYEGTSGKLKNLVLEISGGMHRPDSIIAPIEEGKPENRADKTVINTTIGYTFSL